jgi:hypothetical protein
MTSPNRLEQLVSRLNQLDAEIAAPIWRPEAMEVASDTHTVLAEVSEYFEATAFVEPVKGPSHVCETPYPHECFSSCSATSGFEAFLDRHAFMMLDRGGSKKDLRLKAFRTLKRYTGTGNGRSQLHIASTPDDDEWVVGGEYLGRNRAEGRISSFEYVQVLRSRSRRRRA